MPQELIDNLLPHLTSRHEYFDYLDRWSIGTVDGLRTHMTTRALVKAFLLETSQCDDSRDAIRALARDGQGVTRIDDAMYRLRWPGEPADWAMIEVEDRRYPVVYTALDRDSANGRVDHLVSNSSLLDRAWFATPMFKRLWRLVLDAYPPHRFSKIVFEHESVYESVSDATFAASDDDDVETDIATNEGEVEVERRRARMQITERIGKLDSALRKMRRYYDPLESIVSLRIPAPGHGGHDIYYDGRFTNRSDSLTALRQTIQDVTGIYRSSTEMAEQSSWPRAVETGAPISLGVPILVKFSQELDPATFERWVSSLRRKNNRFRLWGNPITMGQGKVHVYAIDNHLWQPIDLEITRRHLYALLPAGTCGNSIHRLVTNVQRFVDPRLETYVGAQKYEHFIDKANASTNGRSSSRD